MNKIKISTGNGLMNIKTNLTLIAGGALLIFLSFLNHTPAVAKTVEPPLPQQVIEEAVLEPEPLVCINCHRSPNINTNEGVIASQAFCLDCHKEAETKKKKGTREVSLQVTSKTFNQNQPNHRFIACINCHVDVARSPHKTLTGARCMECHPPHSEGPSNAPHLRVSCQACHFQSKYVRLDPKEDRVKLAHFDDDSNPLSLSDHSMADAADEQTCKKCHFKKKYSGRPGCCSSFQECPLYSMP
jgi:hypothetical protein